MIFLYYLLNKHMHFLSKLFECNSMKYLTLFSLLLLFHCGVNSAQDESLPIYIKTVRLKIGLQKNFAQAPAEAFWRWYYTVKASEKVEDLKEYIKKDVIEKGTASGIWENPPLSLKIILISEGKEIADDDSTLLKSLSQKEIVAEAWVSTKDVNKSYQAAKMAAKESANALDFSSPEILLIGLDRFLSNSSEYTARKYLAGLPLASWPQEQREIVNRVKGFFEAIENKRRRALSLDATKDDWEALLALRKEIQNPFIFENESVPLGIKIYFTDKLLESELFIEDYKKLNEALKGSSDSVISDLMDEMAQVYGPSLFKEAFSLLAQHQSDLAGKIGSKYAEGFIRTAFVEDNKTSLEDFLLQIEGTSLHAYALAMKVTYDKLFAGLRHVKQMVNQGNIAAAKATYLYIGKEFEPQEVVIKQRYFDILFAKLREAIWQKSQLVSVLKTTIDELDDKVCSGLVKKELETKRKIRFNIILLKNMDRRAPFEVEPIGITTSFEENLEVLPGDTFGSIKEKIIQFFPKSEDSYEGFVPDYRDIFILDSIPTKIDSRDFVDDKIFDMKDSFIAFIHMPPDISLYKMRAPDERIDNAYSEAQKKLKFYGDRLHNKLTLSQFDDAERIIRGIETGILGTIFLTETLKDDFALKDKWNIWLKDLSKFFDQQIRTKIDALLAQNNYLEAATYLKLYQSPFFAKFPEQERTQYRVKAYLDYAKKFPANVDLRGQAYHPHLFTVRFLDGTGNEIARRLIDPDLILGATEYDVKQAIAKKYLFTSALHTGFGTTISSVFRYYLAPYIILSDNQTLRYSFKEPSSTNTINERGFSHVRIDPPDTVDVWVLETFRVNLAGNRFDFIKNSLIRLKNKIDDGLYLDLKQAKNQIESVYAYSDDEYDYLDHRLKFLAGLQEVYRGRGYRDYNFSDEEIQELAEGARLYRKMDTALRESIIFGDFLDIYKSLQKLNPYRQRHFKRLFNKKLPALLESYKNRISEQLGRYNVEEFYKKARNELDSLNSVGLPDETYQRMEEILNEGKLRSQFNQELANIKNNIQIGNIESAVNHYKNLPSDYPAKFKEEIKEKMAQEGFRIMDYHSPQTAVSKLKKLKELIAPLLDDEKRKDVEQGVQFLLQLHEYSSALKTAVADKKQEIEQKIEQFLLTLDSEEFLKNHYRNQLSIYQQKLLAR
jgi:hypothetical protein